MYIKMKWTERVSIDGFTTQICVGKEVSDLPDHVAIPILNRKAAELPKTEEVMAYIDKKQREKKTTDQVLSESARKEEMRNIVGCNDNQLESWQIHGKITKAILDELC